MSEAERLKLIELELHIRCMFGAMEQIRNDGSTSAPTKQILGAIIDSDTYQAIRRLVPDNFHKTAAPGSV